ncbi:MAG: hypothetical protein GY795_22540 [Desulfobacterales bacterium]|nr:hypothetical protein [Desulfobacterales bacterium]
MSIAYYTEITPYFSAGVTFNYWDDLFYENQWEQMYNSKGDVKNFKTGELMGTITSNKKELFSFCGWNMNLGFLWKITEHWTLGGVFKTSFNADIRHEIEVEDIQEFPNDSVPYRYNNVTNQYDEKLKMPMSYGIGVAYRFSDDFTISGDIYRTHWGDFEYEHWQGNKTSPISGKDINDSDIDPTTWFRVGGEYILGDKKKFIVPICAGIFYDPAPAENSPDDYYGIALGMGFAYIAAGSRFNRYVFDIAYQFRFGDDVEVMESYYLEDVREHTVYTSLAVHF